MRATFDAKQLVNSLNNITEYSLGFLDGAKAGRKELLDNVGESIIESLKNFIDSNARVSPETLHHVYEWYQTGSPSARLFEINYIIKDAVGLSFNYSFSQSRSYANGSTKAFYDKANIMENGTPVTIRPKAGGVLSFEKDGEQVFTRKPIVVENPGGSDVQGGFEQTLKMFFDNYFTQSFIVSSGILGHLNNAKDYKDNFFAGSKQGKPLGFRVGYKWIVKGGRIEQ